MDRVDDLETADLAGRVARYDHEKGAYGLAETLYRRECGITRRILGNEHPSTLTSMNNLALTLSDQGDFAGAQKIQEEVLEIRRRVLGSERPNTSILAWNLFCTLRDLSDPVRARTVLENDLLWLLDRDPASLGADQRRIREMVSQIAGAAE